MAAAAATLGIRIVTAGAFGSNDLRLYGNIAHPRVQLHAANESLHRSFVGGEWIGKKCAVWKHQWPFTNFMV
jgi:hypothetical protein